MSPPKLFEQLIERSGLSPVFARNSLTRAIARANATPETLTAEQLREALGEVARVLRVFLDEAEVSRRLSDIERLAR